MFPPFSLKIFVEIFGRKFSFVDRKPVDNVDKSEDNLKNKAIFLWIFYFYP